MNPWLVVLLCLAWLAIGLVVGAYLGAAIQRYADARRDMARERDMDVTIPTLDAAREQHHPTPSQIRVWLAADGHVEEELP